MRIALLALVAALATSAAFAGPDNGGRGAADGRRAGRHPPPPAGWAERCPRAVARAFQDVMRAADVLADEIDHTEERRQRRRLEDDLEAMLVAVDTARDAACAAAQPPPPPPPPPPPAPVHQPIVPSQPAFA